MFGNPTVMSIRLWQATLTIIALFSPLVRLLSEPILLTDTTVEVPILPNAEYLEDESGRLTVNDVATADHQWRKSGKKAVNFGVSKSTYWMRFAVRNRSSRSNWVLESRFPHLDYVSLYTTDSHGSFIEQRSGRMFPFSSREFAYKNVAFSMRFDASNEKVFYIKVLSEGTLNCEFTIWNQTSLATKSTTEEFLLGIFFGIMLIMALYNLSLFFSIRDISYLFYVCFVLCSGIAQLILEGLFLKYVLPDHPMLAKHFFIMVLTIGYFFGMLFAVTFLNLRATAPKIKIIFYLASVLSFLPALADLYSFPLAIRCSVVLAPLFSLLMLLAGSLSLFRGYKPPRYFLLAWTALIISTIVFNGERFGLLPPSFLTEHGIQIASALEVLLLSLALGDRLSRMQQEVSSAQRETIAEQRTLTASYARFVPPQLLTLLERKDIRQLNLGDAVEREMTVFFSDIRSFTSL